MKNIELSHFRKGVVNDFNYILFFWDARGKEVLQSFFHFVLTKDIVTTKTTNKNEKKNPTQTYECKPHLLEAAISAYFHRDKEFKNPQKIKGLHTEITSKWISTTELYFMEVLKGKFSETFNYRNFRQFKKPRECFLFTIS